MTRVVVVQPYVPGYRVPFFRRLGEQLGEAGIELVVAVGEPGEDQALRGDAVDLPGVTQLHERRIGLGGRSVLYRDLHGVLDGADLVVMEQARRNLEAYPLLIGRRPCPVALWGHGRTTTRSARAWEHLLLDRLTLRADWFFAYTERGRRDMVRAGFPSDNITVVQNATDTATLRAERASVTAAQTAAITRELGTTPGRTALFLGALDPSKRLYFLLEAARRLASDLPGFTLVIAGDGPLRNAIEQHAAADSWLRYVGPVFGARRAQLASATDVMLMPGRVGLSVVDSFALGLPTVTTDWPGHAPEFEYLDSGVNGVVTRNTVAEFATATRSVLTDRAQRALLVRGCEESAAEYRIESMVDRFVAGIDGALRSSVRQRVS